MFHFLFVQAVQYPACNCLMPERMGIDPFLDPGIPGNILDGNTNSLIRTMDRFGLCEYYSSLGLFLDGEFFDVWKGSLVVVEYKRLLELDGILNIYYDIQSTKGEVIIRTDFSKKILHPDEVEAVQIRIVEIRDKSTVVDLPYFTAPKTLRF